MSPGKPAQQQKVATTRVAADIAKRKPPPRRRQAAKARGPGDGKPGLSPEERCQMIAIAAYHRAEERGFKGGSPEQDWLEAEAEIDRMLATSSH